MDIKQVVKFIEKTLRVEISLKQIEVPKGLPVYFLRYYSMFKASISGCECILIVSTNADDNRLKGFRRRMDMLTESLNVEIPIVYISGYIDWYFREQLIKNGIAFVVPSTQIYLPFLAVMLSNKFTSKSLKRDKLSPSTQYILIEVIKLNKRVVKLSDFSSISLSKMTISRALNELENLELVEACKGSRNKHWTIKGSLQELWSSSQKHLFNPVMKKIYVKTDEINDHLVEAGEFALAKKTMLGNPEKKTYAIQSKVYETIKDRLIETSENDESGVELQVWKHGISIVDGTIHPLMLALSFIENNDDRIIICLEDLLNNFWEESIWSMD